MFIALIIGYVFGFITVLLSQELAKEDDWLQVIREIQMSKEASENAWCSKDVPLCIARNDGKQQAIEIIREHFKKGVGNK